VTPDEESNVEESVDEPVSVDNSPVGDPWFYRYLEIAAYLVMGVALIVLVIAILGGAFLVVVALFSKDRAAGPLAALASAFWIIPAFMWSLAVVFWSALILLLVDMARKLRMIARNTKQRSE
jgi:hypothetical protein